MRLKNIIEIRIENFKAFMTELPEIKFLRTWGNEEEGFLIKYRESTKWEKFWGDDCIFQIHQNNKTKEWVVCEICFNNIRNINDMGTIIHFLLKHAKPEIKVNLW